MDLELYVAQLNKNELNENYSYGVLVLHEGGCILRCTHLESYTSLMQLSHKRWHFSHLIL